MTSPVITVLDAETELNERCGALLVLVKRDPTPSYGSASLVYRGALREGLASLGITPASFSAVTDDDLTNVAAGSVSQLLDVAELKLLTSIGSSYMKVDQTISLGSQKFSQLRDGMNARAAALAAFVKARYGYGLGTLGVASIDLGVNVERRWDREWCGDF